jgi:hypothetical protein
MRFRTYVPFVHEPKYADFSIQQQQHILKKLSEEWTRSECGESPLSPEKKVRK